MIWVLHYVVYWMYIHLLGSHIEYVLHRYVMHGGIGRSGRDHLIHHRHTDPSMNLIKRETDEYKILGHAENLIITFKEIRIFSCIAAPFTYLFHVLYPVKLHIGVLLGLPSVYLLYVWVLWNSIHPYVHHRSGRDFTWMCLPPDMTSHLAEHHAWVKWLIENHKKHHRRKGANKGNFNVTVPGADFIYNTYH